MSDLGWGLGMPLASGYRVSCLDMLGEWFGYVCWMISLVDVTLHTYFSLFVFWQTVTLEPYFLLTYCTWLFRRCARESCQGGDIFVCLLHQLCTYFTPFKRESAQLPIADSTVVIRSAANLQMR
jgi:hypothetical protein